MSEPNGRLALGLSALAMGALTLLLWRRSQRRRRCDSEDWVSGNAAPKPAMNLGAESGTTEVLGRLHGFKVSKLNRLVEGVASGLGTDHRFNVHTGEVYKDGQAAALPCQAAEPEHIRFARERAIVEEAARIARCVRQSGLHRKLPHFHVSDRHLENITNLLEDIAENVEDFWRCSRDEPMEDIMELPLLRLAATVVAGGDEALMMVPATQGSLPEPSAEDSEDFLLLEVRPGAPKDEILQSFRRKALQLHKYGHCVDVDRFHLLNNACQRRVAYRGALPHVAFTSATDPLAVHLLVGADPRESRYREPSLAILDAVRREKVLQKIEILRNWGEVGGSITGLGQG